MGTSSSGGGAGGSNPLIPNWIGGGGAPLPPPNPDPNPNPNPDVNAPESNPEGDKPVEGDNNAPESANPALPIPQEIARGQQRYKPSRKLFNDFIKSQGNNNSFLTKSLKSYVSKGSGGSAILSRRMKPSGSRIVSFINTVNDIKSSGKPQALLQFNLANYTDKPLNEILSALSDVIFKDTGKIYEETQDDSITKQAYSNTVVRICDLADIDLDRLTNENIELMTAIFIEETIAQRVICDIGNNLTIITTDIDLLLELENKVYQIVSGMVRNQISPEIKAVQLGNKQQLDDKIENIYRIAFDAIIGANE